MRTLLLALIMATFCIFSCQEPEKPEHKASGLAADLQDSIIIRVWPKELDSLLKTDPNIPMIDVRSEAEFRNSHIFRSISCDYASPTFARRIVKLNVNAPVIIYDTNSSASLLAAQQMKELGFKRIYEMAGGLFSWAREGRTVVAGDSKIDSSTILK